MKPWNMWKRVIVTCCSFFVAGVSYVCGYFCLSRHYSFTRSTVSAIKDLDLERKLFSFIGDEYFDTEKSNSVYVAVDLDSFLDS